MSKPISADEYLASVPEPARSALQKLRAAIRSAVPPETTETISYGVPTFQYKGPLVGYAAFARHCSLFPMGSAALEALKDHFAGFEMSKGTVRFSPDKPIPERLVKKLVKARIAENEAKKPRKTGSA